METSQRLEELVNAWLEMARCQRLLTTDYIEQISEEDFQTARETAASMAALAVRMYGTSVELAPLVARRD